MKKAITALVLTTVILVVFGMEARAQIPKEGTSSQTWPYSGTFKVLAMGQECLEMTWEVLGVVISDTSEDIFHNASFRCIGASYAVKGEFNNSGFCVATRPDGDQIFWTLKATGKMGVGSKGTSTFVGGTGKLTGIQGGGEYTEFFVRPAAEGTFQGVTRSKGQYKLP
ncbi:MAG TPA: hypothetical protein VEM15_17685 [Thermodesulfobacteriota bacterium]|nr:hypothetical protein [Thermodesulfobacteriota bacterium]